MRNWKLHLITLLILCLSETTLANYRAGQALLAKRNYMAAAPEFFKAWNYQIIEQKELMLNTVFKEES